ncbi:alcohol dehydrogenase, putative [Paecilomyces variotii No. 5]|uniref:Alcohol dehydrogenase, putative n=1 Tax=Byssochlamys spectabilis (strain No. 5 / NBRC 109023) TaxID=1356009 RepID=V5G6G9_BYSSN|nr:alcohol dehydrogenase, putative [Paecilomyces variotii No. 5]
MAQAIPKTTKQWNIIIDDGSVSLRYSQQSTPQLGDTQVLVKSKLPGDGTIEEEMLMVAYRDLLIVKGRYPFDLKPNVVPGSDGAGTVLAVGKHVTRFRPGDKVVTIINQHYLGGSMNNLAAKSGLGGSLDGTLRTVGAFDEQGLVAMPEGLTFTEAATLSCAGLTAWNALFGLQGRQLMAGQWVLTQGTGGVSIFALQFAKAIGARVIATTSTKEKAKLLEKLGADHIINYREVPEWGLTAKALTGGVGVDCVVDVAGPSTLKQSAMSVKLDGTINIIGNAGGPGKDIPNLLDCWLNLFIARGIWVGNRLQMEDMCRAIEANISQLRPVVDSKVFTLEQAKEAIDYLEAGEHEGKICIEVSE